MTPKHFHAFSEQHAERTDYDVADEKMIRGEPRQSTLNMFSDPGNEFHCGTIIADGWSIVLICTVLL